MTNASPSHTGSINIGQLAVGMDIGGLKINRVVSQSTCIITYLAESRDNELFYIEELYPLGIVKRGNNFADVLALPEQEDTFARYLESFLAKARLLTQIEATGSIQYGESHNTAFLQREYEPGVSLIKLLEEGEALSEYDTRLILEGCGFLMQEMQARGLTHGDLQPCNVLIRPDKDASLLGICTPVPMLSKPVPKAAPYFNYTAIENIIANVPQARRESDIYSLGAVLHHCLTGDAPPTARSRFESLLSGQDDPLIPAQEQRRQTFNNSLYRLISTMLKPLRNERPHDIRDILNALQHEEEIDEISETEPATKPVDNFLSRYPGVSRCMDSRYTVYALGGLCLLLSGTLVAQMLGDEPAAASAETSEIANELGEFEPPITDILSKPDNRTQTQTGTSPDSQAAANAVALVQQGDGDRAGVFRELERIENLITPLFDKVRVQLNEQNLTGPAGNNALETYKKILEVDPGNRKAENGINRIVDVLLGQAHDAFDQADVAATQNILAGVDAIDKRNREARRLRREIEALQARQLAKQKLAEEEQAELEKQAEREDEVNDLLGRAAQAFAEFRLIAPADDSALKNYRAVLKLDEESTAAKKGIDRILDYFHERSNQAILDGRFDTAEDFIAKARSIDRENKTTSYLQAQLVTSRERKRVADAQRDVVKQQLEQAQALAAQQKASAQSEPAATTTQPDEPTQAEAAASSDDEQKKAEEASRRAAERTAQRNRNRRQQVDLNAGLNAYYSGAYKEAFNLLQPLAAEDISRAQFRLGVMYLNGRGVAQNATTAREWFRRALPDIQRAARAGQAWAQADLGSMYEDGLVVDKNPQQAYRWYERAAQQGYSGAQTNLGVMFASGTGVPRNMPAAVKWFKRAAEQGDRIAQENLRALGVN